MRTTTLVVLALATMSTAALAAPPPPAGGFAGHGVSHPSGGSKPPASRSRTPTLVGMPAPPPQAPAVHAMPEHPAPMMTAKPGLRTRVAGFWRRNFTRSQAVKDHVADVEMLSKHEGRLEMAAEMATFEKPQAQGWLDRLSLKRMLKGGLFKQGLSDTIKTELEDRSRAGDTFATRDALAASGLVKVTTGGRASRKLESAEGTAFDNTLKNAKAGSKQGAFGFAIDQIELADDMKRPEHFGDNHRVKTEANRLLSKATKAARAAAKEGDPGQAAQMLQVATVAKEFGGDSVKVADAHEIMDKAWQNAAEGWVREAKTQYKAGRFQAAALAFAKAGQIREERGLEVKGFFAKRAERKLGRQLGPHMEDARAYLEQEMAQASAEGDAGSVGVLTPPVQVQAPSYRMNASALARQAAAMQAMAAGN